MTTKITVEAPKEHSVKVRKGDLGSTAEVEIILPKDTQGTFYIYGTQWVTVSEKND